MFHGLKCNYECLQSQHLTDNVSNFFSDLYGVVANFWGNDVYDVIRIIIVISWMTSVIICSILVYILPKQIYIICSISFSYQVFFFIIILILRRTRQVNYIKLERYWLSRIIYLRQGYCVQVHFLMSVTLLKEECQWNLVIFFYSLKCLRFKNNFVLIV